MSTQPASKSYLNGVDLEGLGATIEAVKTQPNLAEFHFRAANEWIDGGHNRSKIQGFYGVGEENTSRKAAFTYDADEPEILLGKDNGANPVEYLLHALAACMTTTLVYHAAARGIAIERIESSLEGDLDLQGFLGLGDNVFPGFAKIRASFKVQADATAAQLEELFKFSPVYSSVSKPVAIEANVEMVRD